MMQTTVQTQVKCVRMGSLNLHYQKAAARRGAQRQGVRLVMNCEHVQLVGPLTDRLAGQLVTSLVSSSGAG